MAGTLAGGFAWILSGRVVGLISALATAALVNRALGPEGRGLLAEVQTWAALFAVLFGCSLDSAIYHFANRNKYQGLSHIRVISIAFLSLLSCVLAAIGLLAWLAVRPDSVSPFISTSPAVVMALIAAIILATNFTVLAQAEGRVSLSALATIVQAVIAAIAIFIGYRTGSISVRFVIFTTVLTQLLLVALIVRRIWGGVHVPLNQIVSWLASAKAMLIVGLRQHVATVATFTYMKINQLIVFHYNGEKEAGLFATGLALATALSIVFGSLQTALYPRVIHAADEVGITIRAMQLTLVSGGIIVLILSLLAEPVIWLYGGEDFSDSRISFRLLLVAVWALSFNSLLSPLYVKRGAFKLASLSAIFLGAISIVLNYLLVPSYKSTGAAIATAITTIIGSLMTLGMFWILTSKNPLIIFRRPS